jgi:PAS domain S-box-containing protein
MPAALAPIFAVSLLNTPQILVEMPIIGVLELPCMKKRESELEKLEKLVDSFSTMGNFTQMMRDTYSRLESKYVDVNSRLAQVNELLRKSLSERNRLAHYLSNILESLDSGVIVTDHTGAINVFNSAAERYTGAKAELALGKKYYDILCLESFTETEEFLQGEQKSGEMTLVGLDGQSVPVAYSVARLRRTQADDQAGMVVILYDLTQVKILEDHIKQVSTLAALGEMAATVAHEIRNPLAGISGFTALLLRDLKEGTESRRLVEKINGGVASLNAIVENLLDYTRSVSADKVDVDVLSVVREVVSDLKAGLGRESHAVRIESGTRTLNARIDPHLFRLIVFNLVKNAMQVNPEGGHVRLSVKKDGDNRLTLVVEDDGPGISPEVFAKLFTPFFTTKTNGTGLGLATVKKLTELHGGRVTAGNRPEGGAVFTVNIPDSAQGEPHET